MNKCEVSWISQNTPMGFGHALSSARKFVGKSTFLLHAGDAYFPDYDFLPNLINTHKRNNVSGTLLLQHKKSLKGYGIAQIKKGSSYDFDGAGLTETLQKWSSPNEIDYVNEEKFTQIQTLMRRLLHLPNAILEVAHDMTLQINNNDLRLSLRR